LSHAACEITVSNCTSSMLSSPTGWQVVTLVRVVSVANGGLVVFVANGRCTGSLRDVNIGLVETADTCFGLGSYLTQLTCENVNM
jgi:hypothetical protein